MPPSVLPRRGRTPARPAAQRAALAEAIERLLRLARGLHSGALILPDLARLLQQTAGELAQLGSLHLSGARYAALLNQLAWITSEAFTASPIRWHPAPRPRERPDETTQFTAPSSNGRDTYTVSRHPGENWMCTCSHYAIYRTDCSHIRLVHAHPSWYPHHPPTTGAPPAPGDVHHTKG
jgi:hypothetical protein